MPPHSHDREIAFPDTAGETPLNDAPSDLPQLLALNKEISKCRHLAHEARRQIEMLIKQNIRLQTELEELTRKESQARHLAYHDGLTGLPNRNLLQDRFHQAMYQAERKQKPLALLMLDLDGFKHVNDQLGHATGDKILQAVAARLIKAVRGADTVCRYGGDEFVIMLPEMNSPKSATMLAVDIAGRLREPYVIDDHRIHMAVSVGVAVYPSDGKTFDDLMNQADNAMYRLKAKAHTASIIEELNEGGGYELPAPANNADGMREGDLYVLDESLRPAEHHRVYRYI